MNEILDTNLARAVTVRSAEMVGLEAPLVEVEVHAASGLPHVDIVGLAEPCVRESKQRVRAAIVASGFRFPDEKITINLAPGSVKKTGCGFDLAIAIGILAATRKITLGGAADQLLHTHLILGELSLSGNLRPVGGIFGIALAARERGIRNIILPTTNAPDAAWVSGVTLYPANNFLEVIRHIEGKTLLPSCSSQASGSGAAAPRSDDFVDLAEIRGQELAKRALIAAAVGGHNLLFSGPPGSGKTLLARALPGILPDLTEEEALETTRVHSGAGALAAGMGLLRRPPFRSPHHSVSDAGLVGGGRLILPGEISLAHNGVLFLDELPEFRRNVLEILREPLESGRVQLSRANGVVTYPARIQLLAAMNPCTCGYAGSTVRSCRCSPSQIQNYNKRLSGPLLDRLDLQLHVAPVDRRSFVEKLPRPTVDTAAARDLVEKARAFGSHRSQGMQRVRNARIPTEQIDTLCPRTEAAQKALMRGAAQRSLSGRGIHRLIRVARTLADLAREETLSEEAIYDALSFLQQDET